MIDPITLAVGVITTALIQIAKKIKTIPLNENNKGAMRKVAAVLTFGGAFCLALTNGNLESAEFTAYLGVVAEGLVAYFVAYIGYKSSGLSSSKKEEYTG